MGRWLNINHSLLCALVLFSVSGVENVSAQSPLFLQGVVNWTSGQPAAWVEVQLVRGEMVHSTTFTDDNGRYAFFGIPGQPHEYRILVYVGSDKRAETALFDVPLGGFAPMTTLR